MDRQGRSRGRRPRGRGGWTSLPLLQRCEGVQHEDHPEVEATITHTATAAVVGAEVDSPAVAAVKEEAAAVVEAGSTRDGEAGAARAPRASERKQQSACFESFFSCKITRKKL
jgi:hypothetical protein